MKNVTIALDDEIHRKARIRAAELGTSLSALVKQYLMGLADGGMPPPAGVREMQAPYNAPAQAEQGPPWLIDGKWSYTKDGKPRKPGAARHLKMPDVLPELPQDILDSFEAWPYDDEDFDPLPFDESQLPPEFRSK
jgi:hypothetical protein